MAEFVIVLKDHTDTPLGELQPSNLNFDMFLSEVGTTTFEIPLVHPIAIRNKIAAYVTDYYLYRDSTLLQAGLITSVKMTNESEMLQIAGKDWMHYLERREYPFDPDHKSKYKFQKKNKDIYTIIESFLSIALSEQDSLVLTFNNGTIGTTINYKIDIADTEDLLSKIKNLADQEPGFDYEVTPFREFMMYSPQKGSLVPFVLEKDVNIYKVSVTDTGPKGNHLLAQGAGTATKLTKVRDSSASRAKHRRLDYAVDFGNLVDPVLLDNKAGALQHFGKIPLFEFDIIAMPEAADNIYSAIKVGDTVPVTGDFEYMSFDAQPHRIVNMKGSVNEQGDEELTLGVNDVPDDLA